MNGLNFTFREIQLTALESGALWWPEQSVLSVSDLHLGKSERFARLGRGTLPPYETQDTLTRLARDLEHTQVTTVICLGDSFDDTQAAQSIGEDNALWIAKLQAGRQWYWIEGNHDPGPVELGGSHVAELFLDGLTFRHIAKPDSSGEVSGHYHPKARIRMRGRTLTRPAFLMDEVRIIQPAYGTYTGGLRSEDAPLCDLMSPLAQAILVGPTPCLVPMPR
ncbi:Calcineurin-like phosphoesterase [Falsiruegeria litorea R37]|uniref:Calcineurin-like phosphoesterase n=1 Tax=Falsiruegeria litorea R37 TaxID=1200284 RepID=A0A1Y5T2D6_9RHOB|nr:ligase-associated DNA damage response endonuclease PdeM [Falsiruegeria litorea]SLN54495.1 Calcineurin-like phosphoesterase [Falsiruegeria litorea R37]